MTKLPRADTQNSREPYCPRCDNNREVLANEAVENDPACVPCPKCRPSAPVGVEGDAVRAVISDMKMCGASASHTMIRMGKWVEELEAALAQRPTPSTPVGVEAGLFPGDVSRDAAIMQLEEIARRASCGMPNIAGEILRVRTGLIIGHHAPPSAPVGVEEMLVVAEKAWHEHQTACRFTTVSGSLKKVCEALARQPAASVVGDARELLAQQLRKDGHATAARVVRQGEENALLTSAIKLIATLAQQPAADTVTVQQAWEWAGGNSGIKATREDLEKALRDLDAVCDDADQQPAVTNPWQFAVDSGLITAHLGVAADNVTREEAARQLNRLIDWHVQIATDPAVNGGLHLVPVQPGGADNE